MTITIAKYYNNNSLRGIGLTNNRPRTSGFFLMATKASELSHLPVAKKSVAFLFLPVEIKKLSIW